MPEPTSEMRPVSVESPGNDGFRYEPVPERTPPDDTGRLSIDDLTGPEMRDLFRELDEAHRAASAAFAADDMEAWVEHAGRGVELFEKFARLNGWRKERS